MSSDQHHSSKKRRLESPERHSHVLPTPSAWTTWNSWNDSGGAVPAVSVHDGSILEQNVPFFLELNDANFNYDTAQGSALSTDFGGSSAEILPFWCFGMVRDLHGTCKFPIVDQSQIYMIEFDGTGGSFRGVGSDLPKGTIAADCNYIVAALLEEPELILDITCRESSTILPKQPRSIQANGAISSTSGCLINITIYGRSSLFEDLGSFFEDHDVHLQDPEDCTRIVPYHNPHKLPSGDGRVILTSDLMKRDAISTFIEDEQRGADLLDELTSQQDLAEAQQPPSIRAKLQRHQLQALTFMLQREQGWAWDGSRADIWEFCEDGSDPYFVNRVSNTVQIDEPPQFYGGIIADPMGLGKTLSMIGLIAYDAVVDRSSHSLLTGVSAVNSSDQTLVVVPPPLLIEWERQFKEHIMPNSLPWSYHYGKCRLAAADLQSNLIVLTTYHTVSTEWKNQQSRANSILFNTRWKRVILDEAHFIRNAESQMARAICSLDAVARWAVTGTPIQNKLADLATLLKFLHVYPYSQKRAFEDDISNVWKSDGSEEAVRRLQRLAGCLLLRRPKATIDLPPREDSHLLVELDPPERQLYDEIRMQTVNQIEQAIQMRESFGKMSNYTNVLQRIEALRMVCNLGLYYHSRKRILDSYQPQTDSHTVTWEEMAQRTFDMCRGMDAIQCRVCTYPVDARDPDIENVGAAESLFSRCWEFTCSFCAGSVPNIRGCSSHTPSCPVATVSTREAGLGELSNSASARVWEVAAASPALPTKVSMLVQDLRAQHPDTKCVVFSTWITTLDLIEVGLRAASISFLRFDGKVPQKDRQGVVDRFRTDPSIKVIMLTLACGATGLTLTEATRAYLMETNWNPTVEDQALARIHRIGQNKRVTTVRFIVRDSFEQRVVELQKTKRDLAAILLGRHSGETVDSDASSSQLELLRALV